MYKHISVGCWVQINMLLSLFTKQIGLGSVPKNCVFFNGVVEKNRIHAYWMTEIIIYSSYKPSIVSADFHLQYIKRRMHLM